MVHVRWEGLPPLLISAARVAPPQLHMMPAQGERPSAQPVTPQDIIFSCCVCLDTLAEVYDDRDRHIGLHSEPNQRTGRITKLYLTGCAHVVCAKHFEGGGMCPAITERCLGLELDLIIYRRTVLPARPTPQSCLPLL